LCLLDGLFGVHWGIFVDALIHGRTVVRKYLPQDASRCIRIVAARLCNTRRTCQCFMLLACR